MFIYVLPGPGWTATKDLLFFLSLQFHECDVLLHFRICHLIWTQYHWQCDGGKIERKSGKYGKSTQCLMLPLVNCKAGIVVMQILVDIYTTSLQTVLNILELMLQLHISTGSSLGPHLDFWVPIALGSRALSEEAVYGKNAIMDIRCSLPHPTQTYPIPVIPYTLQHHIAFKNTY